MIITRSITGFYTTTKPNQTVRLCCHSEYIESCYIAEEEKIIRCPDGEALYTFQDTGDHKVVFEIKNQQATLAEMFAFCFNLTAVKFNENSLENVEDVSGMFAMTALSEIDLSDCRRNQIWKISYMFAGCKRLEKGKLGNLPLEQRNIDDVFCGCNEDLHIAYENDPKTLLRWV